MKKYKIALFHPWIKSRGGGEKLVLELLKNSKHSFKVYTWAYDPLRTFSEFQKYKIKVLIPKFGKTLIKFRVLRGLFFPLSLFRKIPLEKYDKFLISTGGLAEFITFRNHKKGKTYAYVHTPLREANKKIIKWNLENREKGIGKYPYLLSVKIYKFFEKYAWKNLDVLIFNSELSQSRARESNLIKKQKEHVIYPPIDFSRFEGLKTKKGKNFIYLSRLNPPKRQDVLIKAWKIFSQKNKGFKLILIGTKDNKKYYGELKELSKEDDSIIIKSEVSNKELDKHLSSSIAGLFLGYQEDFGIVPLEILSAGKPLLAVDEGGYVKIIKNHPLFYKINEKHSNKKMVEEIAEKLEEFVKVKKHGIKKKIKMNNFIKEIDEVLSK